MSANETVAIIGGFAVAMVVGALLVVLFSLTRTLRTVQRALDDLQRETQATLAELHDSVRKTSRELDRVDTLLATAESVGQTVDQASRLAYLAVANPVVKTMAIGAGARKAVRRIRGTEGSKRT